MLIDAREKHENTKPVRRYALYVSAIYFVVTCLWIQFSTQVIVRIANGDAGRLADLQRYKGFSFMAVTAVAFYFALLTGMKRSARATNALHVSQERWIAAERQSAPALLASCIAHDVANMLTVIRLNLEKLKKSEGVADQDAISRLDRGTDRLMELVKRLRGASSALFNEPPVHFNFSKTVEETLTLMQSHACCENTTVELVTSPGLMLWGYPVLIHQLVMNLLINAAEAANRVGHVRFVILSAVDGVSISVDDNGPGIEPSLREKVIGAFFTTKATGSGLGLSSVRSCVEIHKGSLEISDSDDLGGARFSISLPNLSDDRIDDLRHQGRVAKSRLSPNLSPTPSPSPEALFN